MWMSHYLSHAVAMFLLSLSTLESFGVAFIAGGDHRIRRFFSRSKSALITVAFKVFLIYWTSSSFCIELKVTQWRCFPNLGRFPNAMRSVLAKNVGQIGNRACAQGEGKWRQEFEWCTGRRELTSRSPGSSFLSAASCLLENGWYSTRRAVFRKIVRLVRIFGDNLFYLATDGLRAIHAHGSS